MTSAERLRHGTAEAAPKQQHAPRRAEKSPSAFRTISEVESELDVPQHVLRFWETKFPAVKPLKRGGGRRYYRPEDVELLRTIRRLLYVEGYTIKGVQRLVREGGLRDRSATETPLSGHEAGSATGHEPEPFPVPEVLSAAQRAAIESVIAELATLRDILRRAAG